MKIKMNMNTILFFVYNEKNLPFLTGDRTSATGLIYFLGVIARVVDWNISAW